MREGIVKYELGVIYKLGDPIDLELALVNSDDRVGDRNAVDLTVSQLVSENWSFLYADADLELVGRNVRAHRRDVSHVSLDHGLEVDVDLDTLSFIHLLALTLELTEILHLPPPLLSILLEFLDFLKTGTFLGYCIGGWGLRGGALRVEALLGI